MRYNKRIMGASQVIIVYSIEFMYAHPDFTIMLTLTANLCIITKYQVGSFRIEEHNFICGNMPEQ